MKSDFTVFICTTGGLDAANTMDTFNILTFNYSTFMMKL